jgi:glycine cleavage system H protein
MIDDLTGVCGITDHAQNSLGDIVFVEFTNHILNSKVGKKETIAIVESPKAASDVYAPVAGKIIEVNRDIEDSPENINKDPYGEGWLFKIEIDNPDDVDELITPDEYLESIIPEE